MPGRLCLLLDWSLFPTPLLSCHQFLHFLEYAECHSIPEQSAQNVTASLNSMHRMSQHRWTVCTECHSVPEQSAQNVTASLNSLHRISQRPWTVCTECHSIPEQSAQNVTASLNSLHRMSRHPWTVCTECHSVPEQSAQKQQQQHCHTSCYCSSVVQFSHLSVALLCQLRVFCVSCVH
jgi:predicted metal-binding protein